MHADSDSTRERLVDSALYLFWLQGYAATGVAEILSRAGVRSGSFYYFFRSKESLLLAVLQRYIETLDLVVTGPVFAQTSDPIERIFGILEFYRRNLIRTACTYGCPIGRLALEIPEQQKQVHRLLADNFDGWTSAIEGCLRDARNRLPADLDLKALSQFVLTVMEGGVMQARAHARLAPFDASVSQLRNYFRLLTKAKKTAKGPPKTTRKEAQ
jgi:TetR/AcrR family transcriptional regulator, transcriptional repressor for nem operon